MAERSRPRRLHPGEPTLAAGYVRVSLERQAEGHSPDVQREAIRKLAAQEGYVLALLEEDHERGSRVDRVGYQKIIEAVRQGTIHAIIVFMFDRWGRDGAEWLTRAREFERLGVPIISVQEGRDQGGILRFVRAGMAEEYSRQLAKRVRPAREAAARTGTHMGETPLGYRRVYPAHEGSGRRPPGELVIDEATAWIVRALYQRYAAGGESIRSLVVWLNAEVGRTPEGKLWGTGTVRRILGNPTYRGLVRYNHAPEGTYERAAPGAEFAVPGRHPALVEEETWATVQRRLRAADRRQNANKTQDRHGRPLPIGAGLWRCQECGASMVLVRPLLSDQPPGYSCMGRHMGRPCHGRGYQVAPADAALLAEVCRLRAPRWDPRKERLLVEKGTNARAEAAAATVRALEAERERLVRHTRLLSLAEEVPAPEQLAAFQQVSTEIVARIRALEVQAQPREERTPALPALRALHERIKNAPPAAMAAALHAQGSEDAQGALRALVAGLVQAARIVERIPERRARWMRAEVRWTPLVQDLLTAGLLTLAPPPIPTILTGPALRRDRDRDRRRRAATRATPEAGTAASS